jgi:hypothetical protein
MPPLTANGAACFFLRQMDLPATTQSWQERRSAFEHFSLKTIGYPHCFISALVIL